MKKHFYHRIIAIVLISLAILSGCEIENNPEGNGNVTTKRRSVKQFSELQVNGVFTVYMNQGPMYKVEVVTDDNLQQLVKTENLNNTFIVETDADESFEATRMDVYITVPDIKQIKLEGVNSFYCLDTMELDEVIIDKKNTGFMRFNAVLNYLSINSSDVGDFELNGKALELEINNEMTGDIFAYGFLANSLTIIHSGTGTAQITATTSLQAEIDGVGDIYCKGYPPELNKSGEGLGHLYMVK